MKIFIKIIFFFFVEGVISTLTLFLVERHFYVKKIVNTKKKKKKLSRKYLWFLFGKLLQKGWFFLLYRKGILQKMCK